VKGDLLYAEHILESIAKIEKFCGGGEEEFYRSELVQDAAIRNLQVLAESTQRLSEGLKSSHPEVDWRGIAAFRNVLVHGYLGLNLCRIWEVITIDLPALKPQILRIRDELQQP
jgi:uncharacterized protein with HEPN domain